MQYRHNYWKELWWNRPWVYIPEVIRFIRRYPPKWGRTKWKVWIRNVFYLNWQVCLEREDEGCES